MLATLQVGVITHRAAHGRRLPPKPAVIATSVFIFGACIAVSLLPLVGVVKPYALTDGGFCYVDWYDRPQAITMLGISVPTMAAVVALYGGAMRTGEWETPLDLLLLIIGFLSAWVLWPPASIIGLVGGSFPQYYMIAGGVGAHAQALINPFLYGVRWRNALVRHGGLVRTTRPKRRKDKKQKQTPTLGRHTTARQMRPLTPYGIVPGGSPPQILPSDPEEAWELRAWRARGSPTKPAVAKLEVAVEKDVGFKGGATAEQAQTARAATAVQAKQRGRIARREGAATRAAAARTQVEEDSIERKVHLGHVLSADEIEEQRQRAAQEGKEVEAQLDSKLELGHMLSADEVEEQRQRAAREEEEAEAEAEAEAAEAEAEAELEAAAAMIQNAAATTGVSAEKLAAAALIQGSALGDTSQAEKDAAAAMIQNAAADTGVSAEKLAAAALIQNAAAGGNSLSEKDAAAVLIQNAAS